MKYKSVRNMFFDYLLMEKNLASLNNNIKRYERNMPYDSGPASEYVMEEMDKIIVNRNALEKEMKILYNEILKLLS